MVAFTCDGCGLMLKKSQVDQHAARCRRCQSVSCMDCNVSFYEDDYRGHTSCMTEQERYEKGSNTGNDKKKSRKLSPHELWMQLIQSPTTLSQAPVSIRPYLETLASGSYENIPRKEKPFRNFAANSLKLRSTQAQSIVRDLWIYLYQQRSKQVPEKIDSSNSSALQQGSQSTNRDHSSNGDKGVTATPETTNNNDKSSVDAPPQSSSEPSRSASSDEIKMKNNKNGKKAKRKPTTTEELSAPDNDHGPSPRSKKQRKEQSEGTASNGSSNSSSRAPVEGTTNENHAAAGAAGDIILCSALSAKQVSKAMKKVLQKSPQYTLSMKRLRKAVQAHLDLPKEARKQVKELVREQVVSPSESASKTETITKFKFLLVDQKTVKLNAP